MHLRWSIDNLWRQTAGIWPVAVPTSLTWHDIGVVLHTVQAGRVDLIVEIGVDQGGLSALLLAYAEYSRSQSLYPHLEYLGIDINLDTVCQLVIDKHPRRFFRADAFNPETLEFVKRAISVSNRTLIFCDGGDKPREIRTYGPILRPGDFLLAHDYHNEYTDEALVGLPDNLVRLTPSWLEETLLCLFEGK